MASCSFPFDVSTDYRVDQACSPQRQIRTGRVVADRHCSILRVIAGCGTMTNIREFGVLARVA
jgi:hypothetical protein